MRLRNVIGHITLFALLAATFAACSADVDVPAAGGMGQLQLAMPNVYTATRSIPADLGVPTAADFHLTVTNSAGRDVYDGTFTDEPFTLPTGQYAISATYGENPVIGMDKPYYLAEQTATVDADQTTTVNLTARVANALISARFGSDAVEQQRFDRFYSDYALYVNVGNFSIPITKEAPAKSVYVRAGSQVTLRFWGKLKMENDREVSTTLTSTDMPSTLSAADHAQVTLTLPDPESAMTVAISKVEMTEITLDETIPLSWLPVAMVLPMHQYDKIGNLVGTNLIITESYPGMKWRAVITNAAGTTVRAVEGTGPLQSDYTNNSTWPYLPQGQYKASYYLLDANDQATFASSRDFSVTAPTISVTTTGYTSYSKYLEGDIDAANACERVTVYEPSAKFNVSPTLLQNSNYSHSFTCTYDGTSLSIPANSNICNPGNQTNQAVQREAHVLRAEATFDGVTASAQRDLIITGLPYSLNLKSHDEWESSGGVDWFDNDVRLGHLSTGSQYIQTNTSVCIPPSTYFCADYSINVHTFTIGTYLSIKVGNTEILKQEEAGTPFRDTDHLYSGTTDTFHDDNAYATNIHCYNDYGAGQTCSHIYSFTLKYANH